MNLSTQSATLLVLFVTFLWGSWFQSVKHTGNYPIVGFISWMYTFSLPVVWVPLLLLQRTMVPGGVMQEIRTHGPLAFIILVCGMVFAVAMQLHLTVVGRIGLILSTSVSATCCILCGTLVSAFLGGIPAGASFAMILAASLLLILATITCQCAGVLRDRDAQKKSQESPSKSRLHDILLLIFINSVLMSSYPLATSLGIRSPLNPNGMSSLTCMGILVIGAFLGSVLFTAFTMTRNRQWASFWHPNKPFRLILLMALIAACCHFGGNVLHAIAAPVISVTIATAMGNSYHVWSYLWGLVYGEFKGACRKTYLLLVVGILLFVAGVLLLSFNIT